MKILIAEDTDVQREKIRLLLKNDIHSVSTIQEVSTILNLKMLLSCNDNFYDIIFLDLKLKDGDTIKLLELIETKTKAIVIISGGVSKDIVKLALKHEITHIIQKPFSKQRFLKTISEIKSKI